MIELYPLKFKPIFKEKIWGGNKIDELLHQHYPNLNNCGELWAVSGLDPESSIVSNGFLKGNSLKDLLEIYMGDIVGDIVYEKFGDGFPLLFKFINSEDYLSVQVHPGDELAMKRHQSFGKTEMWYIIAADEDAELISGFSHKIDKVEFQHHLQSNTIKDCLRFHKVKAGDVFFIPAGTVHAIGPGILLAEIQQSSDVTYRIFDWDRFDLAGVKRELHTELALDSINYTDDPKIAKDPPVIKNQKVTLQKSEYFTVNLLDLDRKFECDFNDIDSFVVYMCVEGSFKLSFSGKNEKVAIGESVLIPACIKEFEIIPDSYCKLLETYII